MFLIILSFVLVGFKLQAQEIKTNEKIILLGLNYGQANQNIFPFNNANYLYRNEFYKIQINYSLSKKK